jgi:hypothetical protein
VSVIVGLQASFGHNQNGMTLADMVASQQVAGRLGEVIIFRSTGPWSKRWLERGYPSKNFHVKGKSSDWGPHAGLVPYDGTFSKVGYDTEKAKKGTKANEDGRHSGFAEKAPLVLSPELLNDQLTRPEGLPARTALEAQHPIPGSPDLLLTARRSGDKKPFAFRACRQEGGDFLIKIYPEFGAVRANPFLILDRDPRGERAVPLEVMISMEVGALRPMAGDYDLFAVCPPWAQYGSQAAHDIVKPGIALSNGTLNKGLAFRAGVGMDNVMDPRLHTMGRARNDYHRADRGRNWHDYRDRQAIYRDRMRRGQTGALSAASLEAIFGGTPDMEHGDMGNLTPRILRCINELNAQMGATGERAALRRVHHNAESHRFRNFGALTGQDMVTKKDGEAYGDGFPLTVFQPPNLYAGEGFGLPTARYGDVCTLESLLDFRDYATALKGAGYYVPRNWIWGV